MTWPFNNLPPRSGGSDNDRIYRLLEEIYELIGAIEGGTMTGAQIKTALTSLEGHDEWSYSISEVASALNTSGAIEDAFNAYTSVVLNPSIATALDNYTDSLEGNIDTEVGHSEWSYSIDQIEANIDLDDISDGTTKKLLTATERAEIVQLRTDVDALDTALDATPDAIDTALGHAEWRRTTAQHETNFDIDNVSDGGTNLFFTALERSKLSGIEASATADQTPAEIGAALDSLEGHAEWRYSIDEIEANIDVTDIPDFGTDVANELDSAIGTGWRAGSSGSYGSAAVYDTFADAEAATVGSSVNEIVLLGYYAEGDCGQPLHYTKVTSEPSAHDGYITTQDPYYFELDEYRPTPKMFGARADLREYSGIASISTGDATLTTSSGVFTSADVGKHVVVAGASYHHEAHRTTIDSYTDTDEVELTDAATYITSNAGTHTGYTGFTVSGHDLAIGSDDSAAFKDCWNYCRLKKRMMHLGPFFYFIATPEDNLTGSTFLSAAEGDTNVGIVGEGRHVSGVFYSDGIRYLTSAAFFNATGSPSTPIHKVLMSRFKYRGSWLYHRHEVPHNSSYPSGTQPEFVEQVSGQFSVARGIYDFEVSDMAFEDVRGQLMWIRYGNCFRAMRNHAKRIAGGGFIATNYDQYMCHDNQAEFITDDFVMFAGRHDPDDTGFAGTREIAPFLTSIQNNQLIGCGMIKCNHAHSTIISGNSSLLSKRGGIWVRTEEDADVRSGVSSIIVSNNVVADLLDLTEMSTIDGSLGQCITIDAKADPGSGTYIPGDGTSTLYDKIHVWRADTDNTTPSGPVVNLLVDANVLARSLDELTNYSDLDIRVYDALNEMASVLPSKENYLMDPAISDDALRPVGIWVRGPRLRNTRITNNIIAGIGTALYFGNITHSAPVVMSELVVANNSVWDVELGANFNLDDKLVNATFHDNRWDVDPLRIRSGRQSNGSWSAFDDAVAISDAAGNANTFRKGVEFLRETFANCSAITDGNSDIGRYNFLDCRIEADAAAVGFSTSNKGVGRIPAGSRAFRVLDMDLDPGSSTFLQTPSKKELVTATTPSSGATWVIGEEVAYEGTSVAGGLSLQGFKRTATGTGSSDWVGQAYVTVGGNYNQFSGASRTISDNAAASFTVPNGVLLILMSEGNPNLLWVGALFSGSATAVQAGSDVNTTSGTLGGTTGADNKVTVSMSGTTFYIENRMGSSRTFTFSLVGGAGL